MIPNTEQDSKSSRPYLLLLLLTIGLYALNFHINDIWTENESFYADAVREMFESGNFLDIRYNYEERFQKPPMTYWMIATSVALLGNSEFAIRLPILLAAIATAMLTYETARLLHGKKVALLAFALQALSIQFIAGKQYASPEIPLAFFFSLTLYLFIRGRTSGKPLWTILAAFSLGLTMLTKGYPYLIVIGGIIGLYLVLESGFRPKQLLEELKKLHLPVTIPLILVTGAAWTVIMYLLHGDEFAQVLQKETLNRALARKSSLDALENLLFYPEVILWSFFPYSLLFYTALVQVFRKKGMAKTLTFSLSWFAVMLVIFTIAKGKIPTYFIQAHPAMAIITAAYLSSLRGSAGKGEQLFVLVLLVLSSVIALIIGTLMIPVFDLHPVYHIAPGGAGAFMLYALFRKHDDPSASLLQQLQPFATTWAALFILAAGVMPQLEESRPYDQIRTVLRAEESIAPSLPIYLQGSTLHNLPYYAERRVEKHADPVAVQEMPGPVLALLETDAVAPDFNGKILWEGMIYRKRSSESRLLIFIRSHLDAKKGDTSGFRSFSLIYKPEQLQDVQ